MSQVCENCNRPMVSAEEWIAAVEKINGWPDLCHNDGTGDTYSAQEFCAEARDKWLTAEVERLRAELAKAESQIDALVSGIDIARCVVQKKKHDKFTADWHRNEMAYIDELLANAQDCKAVESQP